MIKITLETAAHSYVEAYRRRNCDAYDESVAFRRLVLNDFIDFMRRSGRERIDADELTADDLRSYSIAAQCSGGDLLHLHMLSIIGELMDYCMHEGFIERDPRGELGKEGDEHAVFEFSAMMEFLDDGGPDMKN